MAFVLCAGCAKTPAPAEHRPPASASASALTSAAPSAAAAPPRWLGDGCHAGVGTSGTALARAERVAEACAPGTEPLGEPKSLDGSGELRFSLPDAACVRLIAVAERADADVSLVLLDASGDAHGEDSLPGSIALVGPSGPVCFGSAGALTAKVGQTPGGGAVVVSARRAR
ncbi:MAG: hypothetical protein AMXMBFR56_74570 [Polyangiaceae bacterium]